MFVWDLPARKDCLAGSITSVNGPLSYLVTLDDGRIVRRYVDHIRSRSTISVPPSTSDLLAYPNSRIWNDKLFLCDLSCGNNCIQHPSVGRLFGVCEVLHSDNK